MAGRWIAGASQFAWLGEVRPQEISSGLDKLGTVTFWFVAR